MRAFLQILFYLILLFLLLKLSFMCQYYTLLHQIVAGCICSVEDHGYLVNIGIGEVKAFLHRNELLPLGKYNYLKNQLI
jgi:DNA-directed RNA polymerase subunit E'/Rpb7